MDLVKKVMWVARNVPARYSVKFRPSAFELCRTAFPNASPDSLYHLAEFASHNMSLGELATRDGYVARGMIIGSLLTIGVGTIVVDKLASRQK